MLVFSVIGACLGAVQLAGRNGRAASWKKDCGDFVGLGNTRWMPRDEAKDAPRLPGFTDRDTQRWIVETTGNDITKVTSRPF